MDSRSIDFNTDMGIHRRCPEDNECLEMKMDKERQSGGCACRIAAASQGRFIILFLG